MFYNVLCILIIFIYFHKIYWNSWFSITESSFNLSLTYFCNSQKTQFAVITTITCRQHLVVILLHWQSNRRTMKLQQRDTVTTHKTEEKTWWNEEDGIRAYSLVQVLSVGVIYIRVIGFAILPSLVTKCQRTASTGEVSSQVLSSKTVKTNSSRFSYGGGKDLSSIP